MDNSITGHGLMFRFSGFSLFMYPLKYIKGNNSYRTGQILKAWELTLPGVEELELVVQTLRSEKVNTYLIMYEHSDTWII